MATTAHGPSIDHICSACGTTNNIPAGQILTAHRCHACKETWRVAEPIAVDETSFVAIAREAQLPIVTAFCDARSAACRMIAPDLDELAHEMAGRAIFLKVDTDQHPDLSYWFGVSTVPHLLILRGGKVVSERSGALAAPELRRWLYGYVGPYRKRTSTWVKTVSGFLAWLALVARYRFHVGQRRKEARA